MVGQLRHRNNGCVHQEENRATKLHLEKVASQQIADLGQASARLVLGPLRLTMQQILGEEEQAAWCKQLSKVCDCAAIARVVNDVVEHVDGRNRVKGTDESNMFGRDVDLLKGDAAKAFAQPVDRHTCQV
jgi:hypothetical protein